MGQTVITSDGRFEWDADKSTANKKKHGLSFEEVLSVFDDPYMLETYDENHSSGEERMNGLGLATLKEEEAYYEHIAGTYA